MSATLDNLAIKHLIMFEYDTARAIAYHHPHFLFNLEDSIPYKALKTNDFGDYNTLLKTTYQPEHSFSTFIKLRDSFDSSILSLPQNKIKVKWDKTIERYIVLDGCHRLSLIKFFGLHKNSALPTEWVNYQGGCE